MCCRKSWFVVALGMAFSAGVLAAAEKSEPIRSGKEAIEEALSKPVTCEFVETPLSDIVDYFRDLRKINIVLDRKALGDAGIAADTPLKLNLANVPLRNALNLMLRQAGLAWTIEDEVLLITTVEGAEARLATEVYDVADLVACRDDKNQLWDDYETLIDAITSTVKPTSWDAVGGPGSVQGATFGGAKVLIVGQTQEVHEELVVLLTKIRSLAPKDGKKVEPPRRNRPEPRPVPRNLPLGSCGGSPGAGQPRANPDGSGTQP